MLVERIRKALQAMTIFALQRKRKPLWSWVMGALRFLQIDKKGLSKKF
jgi:hypothetical protein